MARRGWDSWNGWPAPTKPLAAEGGVRAKAQRGRIGATWWSQRFIAVLESFNMGARLERGRRYARSGQVMDLAVTPGLVTASVQGSRAKPYKVLIAVEKLGPAEWERVEGAMAGRAVFLARLLAGEMPEQIEEAFAACKLSVFPRSRRDLDTACSCPDSANPCKHIAATYYLLAEAFDDDPFLILAWRGRSREELLAGLRARRAAGAAGAGAAGAAGAGAAGAGAGVGVGVGGSGSGGVCDPWESVDAAALPVGTGTGGAIRAAGGAGGATGGVTPGVDRWWTIGAGASDVTVRPRAAAVPDALLLQLDPTTLAVRGTGLAELLRPAYPIMISAATARAVTLSPSPPDESW